MDLVKDHIAVVPKTQTCFGRFQFLFAFISWAGVIGSLMNYYSKDKENFECESDEESSQMLSLLCYSHFDEEYNSPLPQLSFAVINGVVLVGIWIGFALYSGPRLHFYKRRAEVARASDAPRQLQIGDRQNPECKVIGDFCSYLLQIFIRVIFLVSMVALLLLHQTFQFRRSFNCQLTREEYKPNASSMCLDAYFEKKYHSNIAMLALDLIQILLATVEAVIILTEVNWGRGLSNDPENVFLFEPREFPQQLNCCGYPVLIPTDTEFVSYLLREHPQEVLEIHETVLNAEQISAIFKSTVIEKTKHLSIALPLYLPSESLNIDKVYTTTVLQNEKANSPQNASTDTDQLRLDEIFNDENGNSLRDVKNILIYGCAGVGKSMLCQKLIRDWATGKLFSSGAEPGLFSFVFLLKFQELNGITENISLSRLLNCSPFSPIDDETCRCIVRSMPTSVLIIFDGIDQFRFLSCCAGDLNYTDDNEAEMPVSAWYAKLVCGKVMKGCTVVTTARPNAVKSFPRRFEFDKVVKLGGFTLENAKSFIGKLLESEPEARDRVRELISSDMGIEALVCIPENCVIICCSILYKVRQAYENQYVSRSSTLTEICDGLLGGLLHLFTVQHNSRCVGESRQFKDIPHAAFEKLFALAYRGIESDKSLFTRRDLEEFALPEKGIDPLTESSLLQCLPFIQTGPTCFETLYCFHPIMQKFLAAKHLETKLFSTEKEFAGFMKAVGMSTKWDMVIQFVAGLLKSDAKIRYLIRSLRNNLPRFKVRSEGEQLLLEARCCFEHNDDSITTTELAANIQGCIDLSGCSVSASDNRVILYLLSRCRRGAISTLRMFNNIVGSKECQELANLMASGHGPTKELYLSNNHIGDDGIGHLCRGLRNGCCSLEHLNLSGNGISTRGIQLLLDFLKKSPCQLKILNLACNKFDYTNALQLSRMLVDGTLPLDSLSLARCKLDNFVVAYLVDPLINSNCHLQDLDLSHNNFTEDGINYLAVALRERECYLQSLKLSGNRLTDESVQVLSQSLVSPLCTIQSLDLASTGITDTGAKYIASALRSGSCNLKCLDLSANSFGNSGCAFIANAAASSSSPLQVLLMNQTGISDSEALLFVECFQRPKLNKLRSLYLYDNRISEECEIKLLCSFLDVDPIYWEQSCGKLYI